jgi:hypothetical protein
MADMRASLVSSPISKPLLLSAALGLASLAACSGSDEARSEEPQAVSAAEARKLLTSTPWLDHMPAGESDPIDLLQLDTRGNGVYVHGSAYRGSYEMFRYEATNDELRLTFLENGARAKTGYRIERMKRKGFDLRLTFTSSPRGPAAYYGFESGRALPDAVQKILPTAAPR